MDKRMLQFIMVVFLIVMVFNLMNMKPPEQKEGQEQQAPELNAVPEEQAELLPEEQALSEARDVVGIYQKKPQRVVLQTASYHMAFTSLGGRPVSWQISDPDYTGATAEETSKTVELIPQVDDPDFFREYPTEIKFSERKAEAYNLFNDMVTTPHLTREGDTHILSFDFDEYKGISVRKTFEIPDEGFLNTLTVEITNNSSQRIIVEKDGRGLVTGWGAGFLNIQEKQTLSLEKRYLKAVYNTDGQIGSKRVELKNDLSPPGKVSWAGIESNYYAALLIPENFTSENLRVLARGTNVQKLRIRDKIVEIPHASVEVGGAGFTLKPGETKTFTYRLFVGPKHREVLKAAGNDLDRIILHGSFALFRGLCLVLLSGMRFFYSLVGNYGIAIILLTVVVRVVTHPLTHKGMKLQAKAMEEQAKVKPFVEEINKKYKDNPQKKNQEVMKLYKQHGINPLGFLRGCLPMILQIPIFIALFYVLQQAIELKGQPFLWIKDLALPDRLFTFEKAGIPLLGQNFNLLPILMGISQIFVSKFTTTQTGDATQKQMMYFMPIIFMFIFYNWSSGLVLYWLVSNIWQGSHQAIAKRIIHKEKKA